jgi:hypothetical protein
VDRYRHTGAFFLRALVRMKGIVQPFEDFTAYFYQLVPDAARLL